MGSENDTNLRDCRMLLIPYRQFRSRKESGPGRRPNPADLWSVLRKSYSNVTGL